MDFLFWQGIIQTHNNRSNIQPNNTTLADLHLLCFPPFSSTVARLHAAEARTHGLQQKAFFFFEMHSSRRRRKKKRKNLFRHLCAAVINMKYVVVVNTHECREVDKLGTALAY